MLVGAAYAALRFKVMGGIGGYAQLSLVESANVSSLAEKLLQLLHEGLGGSWYGPLIAVLILFSAWIGHKRNRQFNGILCIGIVILLIPPLIPILLITVTPYGASRTLIVADWMIAVWVAWNMEGAKLRYLLSTVLIFFASLGSYQVTNTLEENQKIVKAENNYIINGDKNSHLIPNQFLGLHYLESLRKAVYTVSGFNAPSLISNTEEFIALGTVNGRKSVTWNELCQCVGVMGFEYDNLLNKFQHQISAGEFMPLEVDLFLKDKGRYKIFGWKIIGETGVSYLEVKDFGRLDVTPTGQIAFGIDTTAMLGDSFHIRANIETPKGELIRSPWLELRTNENNHVEWSRK